jgi:hypothetical protein
MLALALIEVFELAVATALTVASRDGERVKQALRLAADVREKDALEEALSVVLVLAETLGELEGERVTLPLRETEVVKDTLVVALPEVMAEDVEEREALAVAVAAALVLALAVMEGSREDRAEGLALELPKGLESVDTSEAVALEDTDAEKEARELRVREEQGEEEREDAELGDCDGLGESVLRADWHFEGGAVAVVEELPVPLNEEEAVLLRENVIPPAGEGVPESLALSDRLPVLLDEWEGLVVTDGEAVPLGEAE